MVKFITNLEAIPAEQAKIDAYYAVAAERINRLLGQHDIRDLKGDVVAVDVASLQAMLLPDNFLGPTPLHAIFCDQKQAFVPQEIVHVFRAVVSDAPEEISIVFFNQFLTLIEQQGWQASLSDYFEKQHHVSTDAVIVLDALTDFSFSQSVYRVTFRLRQPTRKTVTVFFKRMDLTQACHEKVYARLQQQHLVTACLADVPHIITNIVTDDVLLLSSVIPGISSDAVLSALLGATKNPLYDTDKPTLHQALEKLIAAFIRHAVLGDLLARNDRHLMNSSIASLGTVVFNLPDQVVAFAHAVSMKGANAFSLIDMDMQWLLEEKNTHWIFADVACGLSEINLLSLLDPFNDDQGCQEAFFEQRKAYVKRYFEQYCEKKKSLLTQKDQFFTMIKETYPAATAREKINFLKQTMSHAVKDNAFAETLFARYLLQYRVRRAYRSTLESLYLQGKNNPLLMKALKATKLLQYLPPKFDGNTSHYNVFIQLQCFRGVLSESDTVALDEHQRISWESVVQCISSIAKQYQFKLYRELNKKLIFIKQDTHALLSHLNLTDQLDAQVLSVKTQ